METGGYVQFNNLLIGVEKFDGKEYVPMECFHEIWNRLIELEQKGKELEQHGKALMDLKCELDDARTAYKVARAENKELSLKLEKCQHENHELLGKVEWYKGQIEAYQYCMNCRR